MTIQEHPVIGTLNQWRGVFPTKFQNFDTGQIYGLAWVDGSRIEFLAVGAHDKGIGHFRDFIAHLKTEYSSIRFWAIMNDTLSVVLTRYGFAGGFDVDEHADQTDVMDWNK